MDVTHGGKKEHVIQVSAGISFSIVLTESGKGANFLVTRFDRFFSIFFFFCPVFSFGSAEKGQLGNGTTGERITTGNKTTYDIEVDPGAYFRFSSFWYLLIAFSLYQGVRWQKYHPNCFWSTA